MKALGSPDSASVTIGEKMVADNGIGCFKRTARTHDSVFDEAPWGTEGIGMANVLHFSVGTRVRSLFLFCLGLFCIATSVAAQSSPQQLAPQSTIQKPTTGKSA